MRPKLVATIMAAVAAVAERTLPAPCSEFYTPCDVSYHNVATLGPVPKVAMEQAFADEQLLQTLTANEYFDENLDEEGGEFPKPGFVTRMDLVREKAANFISAGANETVLFQSTTLALNAIAEGVVSSGFLSKGHRVLTTDQEHDGGLAGWRHWETAGLITVDVCHLPIPETRSVEAIVASFERLMTPETKVLAVSHVLTTTGAVLPVAALAEMAHRRGAVIVVDGAQALGMDVSMQALAVDAYATSAHKWLLAPTGNGILYLSQNFQPHVKATVLDGGVTAYTRSSGTRPVFTTLALGYALDYINSFGGLSMTSRYNLRLASLAYEQLSDAGLRVITARPEPDAEAMSVAPILTFELPGGMTSLDIGRRLFKEHRIVTKMTGRAVYPSEWPEGSPEQAIRLTFHIFNSEEEVTRTVDAIRSVVDAARSEQAAV